MTRATFATGSPVTVNSMSEENYAITSVFDVGLELAVVCINVCLLGFEQL